MERIQKILAKAGVGSRRYCEQLIADGRVKVNGNTVKLGDKATEKDTILLDNRPVSQEKKVYLMLNKPPGYITSTIPREHGEKTIMSLVRLKERVFPVGRLDKNSQGLLLLTNDGELANRLTHPSFNVEKEYIVWTAQPFRSLGELRNVVIEDRKLAIKSVFLETDKRIKLVIHEGRKHILRKAFWQLGYKILRLKRTRIANLELQNVKQGTWRFLSNQELRSLREFLEVSHQSAGSA
ncbi:rRNA pseudouridine synthase [archaeon]|nr:rRNA pseudouridine synthase [archaeon]